MSNSGNSIGLDPFKIATRTPGSLGHNDAASPDTPLWFLGDTPGSLGVNDYADPFSVGRGAGVSRTFTDKCTLALNRAISRLPADAKMFLDGMLTDEALTIAVGVIAVTLAGWALSHYCGVGFVLDALIALGLIGMGVSAWSLASEIYAAIKILSTSDSDKEIDAAAIHLSNAIIIVGPELFFSLLTKGASRTARYAKALIISAGKAGLLEKHFNAFKLVAKKMQRVIIVRNTNIESLKWIERGFPGKQFWFKTAKTSKSTGIVTARFDADIADIQLARKMGHYVVDPDGIPRNLKGEVLLFEGGQASWPLEPGQIIERISKKPFVGDYDLLDVIDPKMLKSKGVIEKQYYGMGQTNITNSDTVEALRQLNAAMGEQRVMHGGAALYDDVGKAGNVTMFFPDGASQHHSAEEMKALYSKWKR
jgi:hypothetical protein